MDSSDPVITSTNLIKRVRKHPNDIINLLLCAVGGSSNTFDQFEDESYALFFQFDEKVENEENFDLFLINRVFMLFQCCYFSQCNIIGKVSVSPRTQNLKKLTRPLFQKYY